MGPLQTVGWTLLLGAVIAMEPYKEEMLRRENAHRADHSSPPLEYSYDLEDRAQEWADHLANVCDYYMYPHAPQDEKKAPRMFINGKICGENIQKCAVQDYISAEDYKNQMGDCAIGGIAAFYGEVVRYPFGDYDGVHPGLVEIKVPHFTQMVWESTKEVGYGVARCNYTDDKGKIMPSVFSVARYFPAGNVVMIGGPNQFKLNVHPKQ